MKNSKTKIVPQQQKFVTIPVKEVEMLRRLTEEFNNCLIDEKIKRNKLIIKKN